jgi:hypothetical protein
MSKLMQALFTRLQSPEGDDGGGGAADRGDDILDQALAEVEKAAVKDETPEAPEAKDEEEEAPREPDGKFAKRIPKDRFDEAVNRERSAREVAERQAAELSRQLADVSRSKSVETVVAEIDDLRGKEHQALLDGKKEDAQAFAAEASRKERQLQITQSQNLTAEAKEQAKEEIRFELTVERMETEHPLLNPDHDDYDQDVVDDVLGWQQVYMAKKGLSPSKALAEAVKKVLADVPAAAVVEPAKGLGAGKQVASDRKQAAVAKNVDAAKRQPAGTKDVGVDSDKIGTAKAIDVDKLTYEEFAALPESTKAELRGDFAVS